MSCTHESHRLFLPRLAAWGVLLGCGLVSGTPHAGETIVTVAGGGNSFADGPATAAALRFPCGLARNAAGLIFIADTDNHRICTLDLATGQLRTICGAGDSGFSGDNVPALGAQVSSPYGLAVDGAGNLFFADLENGRVRRIDAATGILTTVAGGGGLTPPFTGLPAASAALDFPTDVKLDAPGNLYIVDAGRSAVYRVDAATGGIALFAGNESAGFGGDGGPAVQAQLNEPLSVALDGAGNVYIADSANGRIRKVDAVTGLISTVAGSGEDEPLGDGGPATAASLDFPGSVAVDGLGHLIISDLGHLSIRRVDAATGIISTIVGNGFAGFQGEGRDPLRASILFPLGLLPEAGGGLLIADSDANRIRRTGPGLASALPFDSDLDGFPDHVETVATTSPADAASTPFSGQPADTFAALDLRGASVKLNFAVPGKDRITFSGALPLGEGEALLGKQVLVDVAGVAVLLTLDAKGKSTPKGNNRFKLGTKPRAGASKFTCQLIQGSFSDALANEHLRNEDVRGAVVGVPIAVYFNQTVFLETAFFSYRAKLNKSGSGKLSNFSPAGGRVTRSVGR